ncbi:unnamed protein product, partial [Ilex paraguariensis]
MLQAMAEVAVEEAAEAANAANTRASVPVDNALPQDPLALKSTEPLVPPAPLADIP